MPGGNYGSGGKWIHDRAHHIMEDGNTPKDIAYAVATQQAHKVEKSPKDFRTPKGVSEARKKYDESKSHYDKTAERHMSLGAKIASLGGQDLRLPMMGGTKFPTDDSKQTAAELLDRSRTAAEVGPAPTVLQLKPQGPKLKEVAVKMPSSQGSLPQIGESKLAQVIRNDPLVQYLKKEAELLPTNLDEMLEGDPALEQASAPPQVTKEFARRALDQQDDILDKLFGGYSQELPKE